MLLGGGTAEAVEARSDGQRAGWALGAEVGGDARVDREYSVQLRWWMWTMKEKQASGRSRWGRWKYRAECDKRVSASVPRDSFVPTGLHFDKIAFLSEEEPQP